MTLQTHSPWNNKVRNVNNVIFLDGFVKNHKYSRNLCIFCSFLVGKFEVN